MAAAAAGIISGAGGGILDSLIIKPIAVARSRKAGDRQNKYLKKLYNELYGDLENPDLNLYGDAAASGAYADQYAVDSQGLALEEFLRRGLDEGLTPIEEANLNQIGFQQRAYESSMREAALNDLASRGLVTSPGQLLAAGNAASQGAANRAHQGGLDVLGMAQERALDALVGAGNLSTNRREQSFNEDFRRREARDLRDKFNSQMTANEFAQHLALLDQKSKLKAAQLGAAYQGSLQSAQMLNATGDSINSVGTNVGTALLSQPPKDEKKK